MPGWLIALAVVLGLSALILTANAWLLWQLAMSEAPLKPCGAREALIVLACGMQAALTAELFRDVGRDRRKALVVQAVLASATAIAGGITFLVRVYSDMAAAVIVVAFWTLLVASCAVGLRRGSRVPACGRLEA